MSSSSNKVLSAVNLDDYDDDGSKEYTGLLSQGREEHHSNNNGSSASRRQGNRSMVHSLYASPKEAVAQRRQASVPGSPSMEDKNGNAVSPLFISNMAELWGGNHDDPMDGRGQDASRSSESRPSSSMIIEDASPPLPWKESSHSFASREELGTSQRFSMDAISDGAFAVPSSLSDSQQLPALVEEVGASRTNSTSSTSASAPSDTKKRRWGPKGHKSAPEATLIDDTSKHHGSESTTMDRVPSPASSSAMPTKMRGPTLNSLVFDSPDIQSVGVSGSPSSTPQQTKSAQPTSSTFGLKSLSPGASMGIVSGLTSLKNSIMIPALPSSTITTNKTDGTTGSGSQTGSLAASTSSLLDFAEEGQAQPQQSHAHWQSLTSSSLAGSPSLLLRSGFLRVGNNLTPSFSGKDLASASVHVERKKHDRPRKDSSHSSSGSGNNSRSSSPNVRRSTFGVSSGGRSTSSTLLSNRAAFRRRQPVVIQNSAAYTLSVLESEFQQLIQQESQLSAHRIELSKELLSLYSRRNTNEEKEEEAAKAELFEEADSAATTIHLVQERIQKLEPIYMQTGEALWKCKKRQDELTKSIPEMHEAVILEMVQMQQDRENEKLDHGAEMERVHKSEMQRILSEREEVEKERSDIALGQDFLGKNEAELLEHMEEETKTEQEELDALAQKRSATRAEIQELTRKLEQLNSQDKELTLSINTLQRKISTIAQQFDGKAKEVSREKRDLERRLTLVQQMTLQLDRQESSIQKTAQEAEATQDEIQKEIEDIGSQYGRLGEVRDLFKAELITIQQLRLEDESFREMEAGWNMRASSLIEDLKKHGAQIQTLTNQRAADQRAITSLELDLEATQKRISTIESIKSLSVQRRDFKQASHCSAELAECRDKIAQQQAELERLNGKMSGPSAQEQLLATQKEYEITKTFVKGEELDLFKEIQAATTEILSRLDSLSTAPTTSEEDRDAVASLSGSKAMVRPASGQLSDRLLTEMRCEIKGVQEMARIRFGREKPVPRSTSSDNGIDNGINNSTYHQLSNDPVPEPATTTTDILEQRHTLERDIQAAVVEEDYETAADLQAKLDAL